jgi:hypothetical protein
MLSLLMEVKILGSFGERMLPEMYRVDVPA